MLSIPKPVGYEPESTDGAIEIGLIGIAADLAISACLYEVLGKSGILRKDSGFYLSAPEALDSFRATLGLKIPRLAALTYGVSNPSAHLKRLDEACSNFSIIFTARACAVHGGAGISGDVAFVAGKAVADFLLALAESAKWKPYLKQVPSIPALPKERTLIAQELAAMLLSGDKSKAGASITGMYLVLPELTESEPDWLKTLQRVQVTPRAQDISVLIKSLSRASVGEMFKVGKGAKATAVTIVDKSANPEALPIYIEGMKKKFDTLSDAWSGYVGTANGELDKGILSLPPIDSIYRFAAIGIDNIGLPEDETKAGLSAHSLWPFVASALDYSGTKGPLFFLIRFLKTNEIGQLIKQLNKASAHSNKLKKSLGEYNPLLQAVANAKPPAASSLLAKTLAASTTAREKRRHSLVDKLSLRMKSAAGQQKLAYKALVAEAQGADSLAGVMDSLRKETVNIDSNKFPALRLVIDAANEKEDLAALWAVLADNSLQAVSTNARKAIMEIDYSYFGPQVSA
ncbi:hypothetical protein AEM42_01400 [Betaproteobacteria bacterium UKL13-2]|nr:hypothetical protein AEM42_01400 [Betaproteobacteria bacterium UKL13-2]